MASYAKESKAKEPTNQYMDGRAGESIGSVRGSRKSVILYSISQDATVTLRTERTGSCALWI